MIPYTFTSQLTEASNTITASASFDVLGKLEPATGCLFGAYPGSGNASPTAYETLASRKLNVYMRYYELADTFPTAADIALVNAGRTLCIDWSTCWTAGTAITWASVTAGQYDSQIIATANRLAALKVPVFVGWANEPDISQWISQCGPASTYPASYQHVYNLVHPIASNVVWYWTVSNVGDNPQVTYPGDFIDWFGCDPYDPTLAKGSPLATYEPYVNWLSKQAFASEKPVGFFETGVQNTVADASRATWLNLVPAALQQLGIKLWLWWNSGSYIIASGSQSATALASIGASAFFNQE